VHHRAGWLNPVFEVLSYIGTQGVIWVVIALVLAAVWRRPYLLVLVAAADVFAQVLSYALKGLTDVDRPPVRYAEPKPLVHVPQDHSFPSGHSASSFACATVLAFAAPRAAVALYLLAAGIAFSRVYVGVHWPLDVLGGAVLGIGIALALVFLARRWAFEAGADSASSTDAESSGRSASRGRAGGRLRRP
jgi:undecaprenyl-diphosphatase